MSTKIPTRGPEFVDGVLRALHREFIRGFRRETAIIAGTIRPGTFVDRSLAQEDQRAEEDQRANGSQRASLTPGEFRQLVDRWSDCAERRLTTFAVELCEMGYDIESIERQLKEVCLSMKGAVESWCFILRLGRDSREFREFFEGYLMALNSTALNRATICCAKRDQVRQSRQPVATSPLSIIQEAMKKHPGLSYREICGKDDDRCLTESRPIPLLRKCKHHNHKTLVESIDCVDCRKDMKCFLSRERRPLVLHRPPKSQFPQKTKVAKLHEVRK